MGMGLRRPKSPIPKIKSIIRNTVSGGTHLKSRSPGALSKKKPAHLQGGKLTKLPKHVVLDIAGYLCTWDLLHLSLTCKHLRETLLSPLYHTLDLKTNKSISRLLPSLPNRTELHPHIKHLIIRPNNALYTAPGEIMDEKAVEEWTMDLLGGGGMEALEGFVWDGREMAGNNLLNSKSHFYEFSNLTDLSLSVKCPEYEWTTGPPPQPEKLPRRFWAMLIERCPGLTSLSFTGHAPCPRLFDARHIMHGRWENLKYLEVGEMVCFLDGSSSAAGSESGHGHGHGYGYGHGRSPSRSPASFTTTSPSQRDAFCSFLALHQSLTTLSLAIPTIPPSLPRLPSLESLTAPSGILRTLSPVAKRTLQSLRISTLHHTPGALSQSCSMLPELTGLRSLSMWVDFSFAGGYGPGGVRLVVETILRSSTPHLQSIELWLLTRSGCAFDDILVALGAGPPALRKVRLMVLFDGKEVDVQRAWGVIPGVREVEVCKSAEPWLSACGGWVRGGGRWEVVAPSSLTSSPMTMTTSNHGAEERNDKLTIASYEWKDANKSRSRMYTREVEVDRELRRRAVLVQSQLSQGGNRSLSRTPGSTSTTSTTSTASSSGSGSGSGSSSTSHSTAPSSEGKTSSSHGHTTTLNGSSYHKALPHTPNTFVFSTAPSTLSFSSFPPYTQNYHNQHIETDPSAHMRSHSTPSSPSSPTFPHPQPIVFLSDSGKIPSSAHERRAGAGSLRRASLSSMTSHSPPPSAFATASMPMQGRTSRRGSVVGVQPPSSWRSSSPSKTPTSNLPLYSTPPGKRPSSAGTGSDRAPPSTWLSRRLSFTGLGEKEGASRIRSTGSTLRPASVHFDNTPPSVDGHGHRSRPASVHGGGGSADSHSSSRPPSISSESHRSKRNFKEWVGSVVGRM